MNITSKCADMDIPLYEIFNLNPDDFIDENITDLPFSVRILNRMQGNDVFHPFNVRGEGTLDNDFLFLVCTGSNLMAQFAHRLPDTFDDTGAQNGLVVHIEQLVFTRRRTRVDDQNFHCSTS